jgi:hypothetical protein
MRSDSCAQRYNEAVKQQAAQNQKPGWLNELIRRALPGQRPVVLTMDRDGRVRRVER